MWPWPCRQRQRGHQTWKGLGTSGSPANPGPTMPLAWTPRGCLMAKFGQGQGRWRMRRTALGLGAGICFVSSGLRKKENSLVSPNPFENYFCFCVVFFPSLCFYILLQAFCIFISTLKANRKKCFVLVHKHKYPLDRVLNIFF